MSRRTTLRQKEAILLHKVRTVSLKRNLGNFQEDRNANRITPHVLRIVFFITGNTGIALYN